MADIDTQTEPRETTRTAMVVNSPAYLCGRPLGEILVHTAKLPREKLDEALAQQSEKGEEPSGAITDSRSQRMGVSRGELRGAASAAAASARCASACCACRATSAS